MKILSRFLSVATLLALMSAPALTAQSQDDQPYDPPQATQPDAQYDQAPPNQDPQYDQAPSNQNEPMSEQPPAPSYGQQPDAQAQADAQYGSPSNSEANQPDVPARAARLQYLSGSVSLQPQGTGDWISGELNRPLTNGDNVWADKNSRAELSIGTGIVRIDSETSLTTTNIGENVVQLSLHQGAMYLHVRRLYDGETYEVDTPNQAFTVQKPGDYRFDVDSDGDKTVITVWRGSGESTGSGPSVHLESNQQARFYNGTSLNHDIHAAPSADAFDQWAYSRDQKFDHSESARYVSPDAVGSEDLDEYGTWKNTPDYGEVWAPTVDAGWAPYYNGHWVWEYPWGWTWVEYEPWGYAPFHYGRWVWAGSYWGWAPGPLWVRPYYAPALVAWFGGPGWGVNFGFGFGGGFGWCPLGFGEPFIPWYHSGYGYFNRVNITNTRITNINIRNVYNNNFMNGRPRPGGGIYGAHNGSQLHYANLRSRNGFTAASRNTLVNSMPVSRNSVRVSPNQLSRTSLAAVHGPGLQPTRQTMLGGAGRGSAAPARSFAHPTVSRIAPPAVNRGGMAGARAGLGANTTRPGAMNGRGSFGQPGTGNIGRNNIGGPGMNNSGVNNNVVRPGMNNNVSRPNVNNNIGRPGMNNNIPRPGMNNNVARPGMNTDRPSVNNTVGRPGASNNIARPGMNTQGSFGGPRSVPRPSNGSFGQSGMSRGNVMGSARPNMSSPSPTMRPQSVPRPPSASMPRGGERASIGGGGSYGRPAPSYSGGSYGRSAPSNSGGSYGRSMPSNGGGSYGRPSGGGPYARSMPSYGGGGYSRGPAPSYGGGGSSGRAPSMSRAPSYGGGRSYGGGSYGGGRPSGGFGGGRSSGGGGGHVSSGGGHASGGGGGHASGGGGGHSSGGGHSGRH